MPKFEYGNRIKVAKRSKYHDVMIGTFGTVRSYYNGSVTVELDGMFNSRSSRGVYYFTENQIVEINQLNQNFEGETIMEGNYRIALISFLEGSNTDVTYRYACYDESINVNDICVVKSAHHGFGIAKVVGFEDKTDEVITREIICKADFSAYNAREYNRKRKAELKKQMAKLASELQETALFELLANNNSDMEELLKEYKELGNGC